MKSSLIRSGLFICLMTCSLGLAMAEDTTPKTPKPAPAPKVISPEQAAFDKAMKEARNDPAIHEMNLKYQMAILDKALEIDPSISALVEKAKAKLNPPPKKPVEKKVKETAKTTPATGTSTTSAPEAPTPAPVTPAN